MSRRALTLTLSRKRKRGWSCECWLWLLTLGPSVPRRRADGKGPRTARASARDRAHSAAAQDVPSDEPPAARSEPFAQRRARYRGCVLFGYFLLHKHCAAGAARTAKPARRAEGRMPGVTESDSSARMADEAHRDVSRFSWRATDDEKQRPRTPENHPHPTLSFKERAKEKSNQIHPNPESTISSKLPAPARIAAACVCIRGRMREK
jgi:hypothetical protein